MTHNHGFKADFPHLITRRAVLGGAAALASSGPALAASCVADARETAGPFPAHGRRFNVLKDSGVLRRDIRPSFAGLQGTAPGMPLDLEIQLVDAGRGCATLANHAIYIWQCDAAGLYSLYEISDQNYLRGVAVTDANGIARFTTIFPGCYSIRWPHIHFEVVASVERMSRGRDNLLIGQTSFAQADCVAIYEADAAYAKSIRNLANNNETTDMIFRNDSAAQMAQRRVSITRSNGALLGSVMIGLPT
jgi:protocatechuate 3,4-dioxygenase beta subunit